MLGPPAESAWDLGHPAPFGESEDRAQVVVNLLGGLGRPDRSVAVNDSFDAEPFDSSENRPPVLGVSGGEVRVAPHHDEVPGKDRPLGRQVEDRVARGVSAPEA